MRLCFGAILQLQPEAVEAGGELMSRGVSNFLTLSNPAHITTFNAFGSKDIVKRLSDENGFQDILVQLFSDQRLHRLQ